MPDSPCHLCGEMTRHTDEDERPTCDTCTQKRIWYQVLIDIVEGRPMIPGVEDEKPEDRFDDMDPNVFIQALENAFDEE